MEWAVRGSLGKRNCMVSGVGHGSKMGNVTGWVFVWFWVTEELDKNLVKSL